MRRPRGVRWGNRLRLQILGLAAFNSYFWAPVGKSLCIPVLNCYACPIGTTACPIGSLSAFMQVRRIPYYVIAWLGLVGVSLGRAFCGWACPFGFLQDALYRLPGRKFRLPRPFNWLKYALLVALVMAIPWWRADKRQDGSAQVVTETSVINYCSTICPAGTLEAGIPGLVVNKVIRQNTSWKGWSKVGFLVLVLVLMVFSSRSFCRALCPLGGAMALTSNVSLLQLRTDQEKCTRCMRCTKVCPTEARKVPEQPRQAEKTAECVLCLDCVRNCPEPGALNAQLGSKCIMTSHKPASHPPAPVQEVPNV
jgi:ferredoxin-type protein NapH